MRLARDVHQSTGRSRPTQDDPIRDRRPLDNVGMEASDTPPSAHNAEPVHHREALDLHVVEVGRPEKANHRQQRQALHARCEDIALQLARTLSLSDRLAIYHDATPRELTTAGALYPELMPTLNGEWEWIAITLADYEDGWV
jgi:hypothetical protein